MPSARSSLSRVHLHIDYVTPGMFGHVFNTSGVTILILFTIGTTHKTIINNNTCKYYCLFHEVFTHNHLLLLLRLNTLIYCKDIFLASYYFLFRSQTSKQVAAKAACVHRGNIGPNVL